MGKLKSVNIAADLHNLCEMKPIDHGATLLLSVVGKLNCHTALKELFCSVPSSLENRISSCWKLKSVNPIYCNTSAIVDKSVP